MNVDVKVQKASLLPALQNHKNNEVAYAVEENEYFIYNEEAGEWKPAHPQLTVYDMNKQVVGQLPPMNADEITKAKEIIKEWRKGKNSTFILFNKEISLINVFNKQMLAADNFEEALFKTLNKHFDSIRNVTLEEDDTIGIWADYNDQPTYMKIMEWEVIIYNG